MRQGIDWRGDMTIGWCKYFTSFHGGGGGGGGGEFEGICSFSKDLIAD